MHNVRRGPHPSRNKLLCGTPCPTGKGTISEVIVKFSLQWGTHLISQHLNELNPKFQCENQLGFDMSKHSRWNRSCSKRQQAREINFHSFPDFPIRAATNQGVDTQSYIPILEALLHSFNCHFQNLGECRQHIQIYADPLDCKCHQITNRNSLISMQSLDAVSDTCTFIDTTLLAFNKPLFQQHLSIGRTNTFEKHLWRNGPEPPESECNSVLCNIDWKVRRPARCLNNFVFVLKVETWLTRWHWNWFFHWPFSLR